MSIFKDIVNKLLHRGQSTTAQASPQPGSAGVQGNASAPAATTAPPAGQASQSPPASTAATSLGQQSLSQVDVEAVMDKAASEAGQPLNWRTSIVDTLKALGVDSSLETRRSCTTRATPMTRPL